MSVENMIAKSHCVRNLKCACNFARLYFGVAAVVCVVPGQTLYASEAQNASILQDVLASRRAVVDGELKMSVTTRRQLNTSNAQQYSADYHIWFRGNDIRVERFIGQNHARKIRVNGEFISHSGGDDIFLIGDVVTAPARSIDDVFDPRLLGLHTNAVEVLDNCSLDDLVGRSDISELTTATEALSGLESQKVTFRIGSHAQVQMWIAPEQGYSVLRCDVASNGFVQRVESKYQLFGTSWFPRQVRFTELSADSLVTEEICDIGSVTINEGVDKSLFTLASFNLAKGTVVERRGEQMVWDGRDLTPIRTSHLARTQIAAAVPSWRRWLLLINALVMAMLAWLVLRKFSRRAT